MQFCEYLSDDNNDNSFHIIKDDDFQLCFQRGVILMMPTIYMIICGIIFVTRLKSIDEFYLPTYNAPSIFPLSTRPLAYLWLLISILLITIPFFNLILRFADVYKDKIAIITIIQALCESIAWIFYCSVFIMEQSRQLKHSSFTRFYTIWMSISLVKELETIVLRSSKTAVPTDLLIELIICVIHILCSVWMLIMHIFPPLIISNGGNDISSYLMNTEYAPVGNKSPQWERFLNYKRGSRSTSRIDKTNLFDEDNNKSSRPLTVTIPSWMKTKTASTIIRYAVRVKYTGDLTHEPYKYTLWKRFKDFQNIHTDILNIANKYDLQPPLFPSQYEHNSRRQTLEAVRSSLENYINQLWYNYEFQKILFNFIRLNEELPHLNDELLAIDDDVSKPIEIQQNNSNNNNSVSNSYNGSISNTPMSGSFMDAMYDSMQVNDDMPKPMYLKKCNKPAKHHRFDIDIIDWTRDQHVTYNIRIREYYHQDDYIEWYITKRYSEFEKLQKQLSARLSNNNNSNNYNNNNKDDDNDDNDNNDDDTTIITLPKKRFGLLLDIEERRVGLEAYLQSIINMDAAQCDELYSFINLNGQRDISMGSKDILSK